jgi:uncharacterized FlaG/YvyC family protein
MIQGVDTNNITNLLKEIESSADQVEIRQRRPEKLDASSVSKVKRKQTQSINPENQSSTLGPNPIAEKLKDAEVSIDQFLSKIGDRSLRFHKDDSTGKMIIQIVDSKTGDVERQIPPQEFLDMVANLNKVSAELLKDLPKFI